MSTYHQPNSELNLEQHLASSISSGSDINFEEGSSYKIENEAVTLPGRPDAWTKAGHSSPVESPRVGKSGLPAIPLDTSPTSLDRLALLQSQPTSQPVAPDPVDKVVVNVHQDPQSDIPANLDQYIPFWKAYNDDADAQDKEIVESLGGDLDALLIFAGLFSASNVAFIAEAYKGLKEDNVDTTNDLLRTLIRNQASLSEPIAADGPQFVASPRAVRVNALFFASLSCSLFTASGAVLGKQWLNHYKREGRRMTLAERGRERQRKFMGMELWHLEHIVEALPTLLQVSLFFFLGALVDFLWEISYNIAVVIAGFSVITFSFYLVTTIIAVHSPDAPFQTHFSSLIRNSSRLILAWFIWIAGSMDSVLAALSSRSNTYRLAISSFFTMRMNLQTSATIPTFLHSPNIGTLTYLDHSRRSVTGFFARITTIIFPWFRPLRSKLFALFNEFRFLSQRPSDLDTHGKAIKSNALQDELNLECISWLLATSSVDKTLSLAATAALMLPEAVWKKTKVLDPIPYVLRLVLGARAFESKVILDVQPGTVKAVLDPIHALVMKWDRTNELIIPSLGDNSSFVTAFENLLWRVVRAYSIKGQAAVQILEILVRLGFTVEPCLQEVDILYRGVLQTFLPSMLIPMVLGTVIILESPMGFSSMMDLLEWPAGLEEFNMLKPLHGSLLLINESEFIRITHSSVRSFFTDPSRCKNPKFQVSSTFHHSKLALCCIKRMTESLRRNILGTQDPFLYNSCIPDLETRLTDAGVSESLRYACRHWSTHLQFSSTNREIRDATRIFCETGLLPWFEVMSLLGCSDEALSIVKNAETSVRAGDPYGVTATLLQDMQRFIILFGDMARRSAAAIYSVALPLAYPSRLHSCYHIDNPSLRVLPIGHVNFWTSTIRIISQHTDRVNAVAVSRDSRYILTGSADGTVCLFAVSNGNCIATLVGHKHWVQSVAFSPDGKTILSGSFDGTIKIWDAGSGTQKLTLDAHYRNVLAVNFSPCSKYIVSGGTDKTVRLWDAGTGSQIATMEGHSSHVSAAVFSPDGQTIMSASHDTTIRLWNAVNHALSAELNGHSDPIQSAAFSSDGKLIASGGFDWTVNIWDAESHLLIRTLKSHLSRVSALSFSPDNRFVVTGSDTIRVWNILDGSVHTVLEGHKGLVDAVAFTPDQENIISGGKDTTVRIWNWRGEKENGIKSPIAHTGSIAVIEFSPDGRIMASGGDDGEIHLWDVANTTHTVELRRAPGLVMRPITSIHFSPNSKYVTAISEVHPVTWDLDTYQIVPPTIPLLVSPPSSPEQSAEEKDGPVAPAFTHWLTMELGSVIGHRRSLNTGVHWKKPVLDLPIPRISASGVHGYHLAVGTYGGQIMLFDSSSIVSFEAIFPGGEYEDPPRRPEFVG